MVFPKKPHFPLVARAVDLGRNDVFQRGGPQGGLLCGGDKTTGPGREGSLFWRTGKRGAISPVECDRRIGIAGGKRRVQGWLAPLGNSVFWGGRGGKKKKGEKKKLCNLGGGFWGRGLTGQGGGICLV